MSTDGSKEIALQYNAIVINIPAGTFDHGLTRNIGAQKAKGDFIYFTVQDAYLADNKMLAKMVNHFTDPVLMAVTGSQAVPHDIDKNPAVWYKRFSDPIEQIIQYEPMEFEKLSLQDQFQLNGWDDVNAMYRKTILFEIPFIKTNYAEDKFWANSALLKGYKLMYDPGIIVFHYHHLDFAYSFKEKFITSFNFLNYFTVLPLFPSFLNIVIKRIFHLLFKIKGITNRQKLYWVYHNIAQYSGFMASVILFRTSYFLGGDKLIKKVFNKVCSVIPIGRQR